MNGGERASLEERASWHGHQKDAELEAGNRELYWYHCGAEHALRAQLERALRPSSVRELSAEELFRQGEKVVQG